MGDDIKQLEATWDTLAKIFNNWAGIRPRKHWFSKGISERTGYKRLRLLEEGPEAVKFYEITKNLKERELRYLLKRAELNFEQAHHASRLNTVLNVTIMMGALVLFNQLFPGIISNYFKELFSSGKPVLIVVMFLSMLPALIIIPLAISYGHGGTAQARDLKHLLELSLARREYYHGKRHNEDTDKENILRDSHILDI